MMLRLITARAENWTRAALKVSVANESGNSLLMFMAAYLYVHDQVWPGVISVPGSNLFPTALHTPIRTGGQSAALTQQDAP
jgi:hypothetical protein